MKEAINEEVPLKSIFPSSNTNKFGDQFVFDLAKILLSTKTIIIYDDDLSCLEKLITLGLESQDVLLHSAKLLKKSDFRIQNYELFGKIISAPILKSLKQIISVKNRDFDKNYANDVEYLKSICSLSIKSPNIKYSIMNATFTAFCNFLSCINNFPNNINDICSNHDICTFINSISNFISSLFQLEINLIWHSSQNQKLVGQEIKPEHFLQLLILIQNSSNSLVQMLIAEWMWRAKNCVPSTFDYIAPLGKFESSFLKINEVNFRSSLHAFIRNINLVNQEKSDQQIIIHLKFETIIYNGIDLDVKGYIDLNLEIIAIWLLEKCEKKIPDVIIFKFAQIYNISITENVISFLSKEKLNAFEVFSISKPMRFEFHCYDIITKSQSLLFSQRCLHKKFTQRNQILVKKRNKPYDNFLNKRIYADDQQPKSAIFDPNEIEEKEKNSRKSNFEIKNIECDEINDDNESKKSDEDTKNDFKIKIMTYSEINRSLNDLQDLLNSMINDVEKKVMSELNEIIAFTELSIKELHDLSEKHQNAVINAQQIGLKLAFEADEFGNECEKLYFDIDQEKKTIFDSLVNDISCAKTEFINETDRIFTHNALTVFSNNLQSIQ